MRRLLVVVILALTGCGLDAELASPRCGDAERLALVAQSTPGAAYVPCLQELPPGWRTTGFTAEAGSSRISLLSDRSEGRPVEVTLTARCDVTGASPSRPRAEGVRSYLRLDAVDPVYAGTAYDVFPGGCVRYDFAFPRGAHIPLMEDLEQAVGLLSRRELRLQVRERLGVELDP